MNYSCLPGAARTFLFLLPYGVCRQSKWFDVRLASLVMSVDDVDWNVSISGCAFICACARALLGNVLPAGRVSTFTRR